MQKGKLKSILLKVIGYPMYCTGIYFLLDRFFWNKRIYIVMYHKIAEKDDICFYQDITVKKEEFIKQIRYFSRKYCCISMTEAVSLINSQKELDKNYMVFTFDDGYSGNLEHGADIFKQYNISPIIYLTAGKIETGGPIWTEAVDSIISKSEIMSFEIDIDGVKITGNKNSKKEFAVLVGKIKAVLIRMPQNKIKMHLQKLAEQYGVDINSLGNELLNWDQARKLMDSKWEIGSHTMNHINMAAESEQTVTDELIASRDLISERLNYKVKYFAYPFGQKVHYNDFTAENVKKYYRSAVTTSEGINRNGDDPYLLRRIMIANHHHLNDIRVKLLKVKIKDFFIRSE